MNLRTYKEIDLGGGKHNCGRTRQGAKWCNHVKQSVRAAVGLRLSPVNNSNQPVVANTSAVQLAHGMAYIDFGFIELNVMAALPRVAREGGTLPKEIAGTLAVRVAMGLTHWRPCSNS